MAKAKEEKKVEKKELTESEIVNIFARAFNLYPVGISVLRDGKPYINKEGLQLARRAYPDAVQISESGFIKTYGQPGEIAIAYVRGYRSIISSDGKQIVKDFVTEVGTASSNNMFMAKDYPNEMAMTRAINRFLRPALLPLLFQAFYKNVEDKKITEVEAALVQSFLDFGRVTSEETKDGELPEPRREGFLSFEDMQFVAPYLAKIVQAKTQEDLDIVSAELGAIAQNLNDSQKEEIRRAFKKQKSKLGINDSEV